MLKLVILLASVQLAHTNHLIDSFGFYNNPSDVARFTYDFFKTFNRLMNFNAPSIPKPRLFPDISAQIYPTIPAPTFPSVPVKKPGFKSIVMNDLRPGTRKVFRINNGKGIAFRSKDGNAGGMSFSSGNGKGFAFGGTFNGRNNGEFVMSQNSPGTEGKVMYKKGIPDFAKQIFSMFPFGRK